MEYVLLDFDLNYNKAVVLPDALTWELPLPVLSYSYSPPDDKRVGSIIEIRREGSLLVGVTDVFNEDPEYYDLSVELSQVTASRTPQLMTVKNAILRAAVISPIAGFPPGMFKD
ncbi:MAG: hypothetical protein JWO15_3669 [Sphingomonadales bacterium]|nr:hypothetical protein [Sphingomonadales bacterium]